MWAEFTRSPCISLQREEEEEGAVSASTPSDPSVPTMKSCTGRPPSLLPPLSVEECGLSLSSYFDTLGKLNWMAFESKSSCGKAGTPIHALGRVRKELTGTIKLNSLGSY